MTYKKYDIPEIKISYKRSKNTDTFQLCSSQDSYEALSKMFNEDTIQYEEEALCIFLDKANKTIGWFKISSGGLNATIMDVRKILATALTCGAVGLILAHNHPSGLLRPSLADKDVTEKIKKGGELLDIKLLDHLIISDQGYFSFSDEGLI